jgi:antitoxin MazE
LVTKVQKWGNSLGVRIPKAAAKEACIEAGETVRLVVRGDELVIRPVRLVKFRLRDLLRRVTAKNLHEEVSTGDAVGREVW